MTIRSSRSSKSTCLALVVPSKCLRAFSFYPQSIRDSKDISPLLRSQVVVVPWFRLRSLAFSQIDADLFFRMVHHETVISLGRGRPSCCCTVVQILRGSSRYASEVQLRFQARFMPLTLCRQCRLQCSLTIVQDLVWGMNRSRLVWWNIYIFQIWFLVLLCYL